MSSPEKPPIPQFDYDAFELPQNVELQFRFGPHFNHLDLPEPRELQQRIKSAGAIILEVVTNGEIETSLNRVSRGDLKTYQAFRQFWQQDKPDASNMMNAMIRELYGSGVPVAVVDADVRHPSVLIHPVVTTALQKLLNREVSDPDQYREVLSAQHEYGKERDQIILGNISPRLDAVIASRPKIAARRNKQPLGVPVFYGSAHKPLLAAVQHKASIAPVEGHVAYELPESDPSSFDTGLYEDYLAGIESSDEEIMRFVTSYAIAEFIIAHEGVRQNLPYREVVAATNELIGDNNVMQPIPLIKELHGSGSIREEVASRLAAVSTK